MLQLTHIKLFENNHNRIKHNNKARPFETIFRAGCMASNMKSVNIKQITN